MENDLKPREGMEFDTTEDACNFWTDYGRRIGFGVRRSFTNKSKKHGSITSCRFVCCIEGVRAKDKRDYLTINPRPETRTDCKARMAISYTNGKFKVYEFVEEHNHDLHLPQTSHMLACHQKLTKVQAQEIELADDLGLQQRATFNLMSTYAGGRDNLGYTIVPFSFLFLLFEALTPEDDARKPWIDQIVQESEICFRKPLASESSEMPPLKDSGIECCMIMTHMRCMVKKKPHTIFTDQDQAMAKATLEVMLKTKHGLCTWYLRQNGIKHLGNLMKGGSCFLRDFSSCMYDYEDEAEFERSTKEARSGVIFYAEGKEIVEDSRLAYTQRNRKLYPKVVRIASEVSACEKEHNFINKSLDYLMKQVMKYRTRTKHASNDTNHEITPNSQSMSQPKGIKKRHGRKTTRRLNSWHERQHNGIKSSDVNVSQSQ
ncbi:protein FAR1-RELATED SEQUENCE 5-like [Senna tora]|uniref:Protein FAR1-RELATED SEQUENCE 5-like n=1 Tax=Senna tora TaxID=362788 RepID=A0A834W2V7_9FABA|nr:protein FAR1-RELATED SEQUENCE 5-like [Senna tora]